MITVIAGTNRKGSRTKQVAQLYFDMLKKHSKTEVKFFSLEDLTEDFVHSMMYESEHQNKDLADNQDEFFTPAEKLVFVIPEYNGSFPGIFKLFIDAISIRNYKENFAGKKVALIGVATGRGGNIRGLDHLTTSLNYLKMNIFPDRLPLSKVQEMLDSKGLLTDPLAGAVLDSHAKAFIEF